MNPVKVDRKLAGQFLRDLAEKMEAGDFELVKFELNEYENIGPWLDVPKVMITFVEVRGDTVYAICPNCSSNRHYYRIS